MNNFSIYTDGACSGNPGPGAAAFAIFDGSFHVTKGAQAYRLTTNNRMEITAVILALEKIHNYAVYTGLGNVIDCVVFSDSQLVIGTMNLGWKRRTNQDLWKRLDAAISVITDKGGNVAFKKVAGHADDERNILVDRMAVSAIARSRHIEDAGYTCEQTRRTAGKVTLRGVSINLDDDERCSSIEVSFSNGKKAIIRKDGRSANGLNEEEAALLERVRGLYEVWFKK